jgi:hypothetical protein
MGKKKVVLPSDEPKVEPPKNNTNEQNENVHTLPNTFEMFAKKKDTAFIAMTQEASMKADEDAAKRRSKMPSRITSCIHKIRDSK